MSQELDEQYWKDLLSAVRHNEADRVSEMIKDVDAETLNQHTYTSRQTTLLIEAARLSNEEVLNVLVDKGLNVNAVSKTGNTPLNSLILTNSTPENYAKYNRMAKKLLAGGAKDETGEFTSKTDLMCAIQEQNLEEIKRLIKEGADVNAKDKDGRLVWEYALRTNNKDIMQALIDGKVNLEQQNKDGKTALMVAVFLSRTYKDMAEFLIEKGADVNARSTDGSTKGMTPLFFADDKDLVEALIKAGADVKAEDANKETAVWGKSAECLEILHNAGAELNVKNSKGRTLMTDAAFHNDLDSVKFLQEKGFDINAKDDNGMTPLMYAVIGKEQAFGELGILKIDNTSLEFVEQLVKNGAKVSITDSQGRTAVDLADAKCPELKAVLESLLAEEHKTLKKDLGLQATVSKSLSDKKIKEAQNCEVPQQPQNVPNNTKQNGGISSRDSDGRS